jgi:hypothetical protein
MNMSLVVNHLCQQIKVVFMKKLTADTSNGMLAVILSASFISKNVKIKIYRTGILPFSCMGIKLGLLH